MPRAAHPMSFVSPTLHPFLRRAVVADGSAPSIRKMWPYVNVEDHH